MKLTKSLALMFVIVSGSAFAAETPKANASKVHVKVLRADELELTSNDQTMTATIIEVTLDPLAASPPHRHPGTVSGYVAEGTFEFAVSNGPVRTLQAGDSFFEPTMVLHRVGRNPDAATKTRLIVTMIHPSNAKQLVIPEPTND